MTPLILEDGAVLAAEARPDLLNGLTVVTAEGAVLRSTGGKSFVEKRKITLIPYYAWAHRGRGEMEVWLPREAAKARPLAEPTIASLAKVTASGGTGAQVISKCIRQSKISNTRKMCIEMNTKFIFLLIRCKISWFTSPDFSNNIKVWILI